MPRAPLFASALLPHALRYVQSRGGDADALIKRFKLKLTDGSGPVMLPTETFREFMDAAAEQLKDPLFGLHCAVGLPRGAYELVEFALRSAPSLRVILEQLDQFGDRINPAARFSVERSEGEVRIHHRVLEQKQGVGEHGNVFTIARLVLIARELLGDDVKPARVWFAHSAKRAAPELVAFFGTEELDFQRTTNGFALDAALLDRPVRGADPALNAVLSQAVAKGAPAAESNTLRDQVAKAVEALLPLGDANLAKVAKTLHLSERTLQRRLSDEGLQFAALLEELRADLARSLLVRSEAPISEVAEKLGYTDAPTFARAFKRWTGLTPGEYRAQQGRVA